MNRSEFCVFLVTSSAKTIRLNPAQPLTVGREKYNDIVLNDLLVSRQHAIIKWDEDDYYIRDLNSRNGTFLNDERIDMSPLMDGDVVRIGGHSFLVQVASQLDIEKYLLKERIRMSSHETLVDSDLGIRFSESGFSGDLASLALVEVIQTLNQCLKTGLLLIKEPDETDECARIYFENGEIIHAEHDESTGFSAIVQILGMNDGAFEFQNGITTPDRSVSEPTMGILLEACRQKDESHRQDTKS